MQHLLANWRVLCLRNLVPVTIKLLNGKALSFNATIGQILNVLNVPNEGSQVEPNLFIRKTEFLQFPYAVASPPADRTYLLFPKELVWTNDVKLVISNCFQSEAFVFQQDEFLLGGDGGFSFGMVNAYFVRYCMGCNQAHWAPIPTVSDSGF
jgi:hypothetical protein